MAGVGQRRPLGEMEQGQQRDLLHGRAIADGNPGGDLARIPAGYAADVIHGESGTGNALPGYTTAAIRCDGRRPAIRGNTAR